MPLSENLSGLISDKSVRTVDILEFAEGKKFLGLTLFPVQRFLFKLVYGLPLSSNLEDPIVLHDRFNEVVERVFHSEFEFLDYLYESKKINSREFKYPLVNVYLAIGRRGTKTTMSSVSVCHTLYRLLSLDNPYEYLGVIPASEIGIAVVSNVTDKASKVKREISNLIYGCEFFKPFLTQNPPPLKEDIILLTRPALKEGDKNKYGKVVISIEAAGPSPRGGNNVAFIADEFAHFVDSQYSTRENPLDKSVYDALVPSISNFIDPEGNPFGKNYFISSPGDKRGIFYEKFSETLGDEAEKTGTRGRRRDILFVQMPTWWINPRVSSQVLREFFEGSERSFLREYGAEFLDKVSTWIVDERKIHACIIKGFDNDLHFGGKGNRRVRHYLGLDLGLTSDGFAVAVCHHEKKLAEREPTLEAYRELIKTEDVYVFDYVGYLLPEEGEAIDVDAVCMYIEEVNKKFYIHRAAHDQWSAEMFKQWLSKKSLYKRTSAINVNSQFNSQSAKLFKNHMNKGQLVFPDDPGLISEILALKEKLTGAGIKVENPNGHDDRFSAMLKALWLCFSDPRRDEVVETVSGAAASRYNTNFIRTMYKNRDPRRGQVIT